MAGVIVAAPAKAAGEMTIVASVEDVQAIENDTIVTRLGVITTPTDIHRGTIYHSKCNRDKAPRNRPS